MRFSLIYLSGILFLLTSCNRVENKNETHSPAKHDTLLLSPSIDTAKGFIKQPGVEIFDVKKFMTLTDSFLASIDRKNIKLSFTLYSTSTDTCTVQRFDFDPGKGNRIMRLWVLLKTYKNETDLNREFSKLRQEGSDEDGKDMPPGLTYSNDYVIKTGTNIIWLNSGCVYAYFNHQKLKQILLESLNIGPVSDSINCRCGGSCFQNN